ncbi:MAG TPA: type II secretion system protein [Candidatus Dormibacteraeota bacterium]|nr:type II secretion system protein [Candidatus Dormibacteraeota bacterium]
MSRQRGFTLIETTVAVGLLAVIVVAVLSGFSATTLAAVRHQQETTLDRTIRSDAEYIKSQAYNPAATANAGYANLSLSGYSFSFQVLHYSKNANPQFAAANPDSGLQEVILTVTGPNAINEQLDFLKELP